MDHIQFVLFGNGQSLGKAAISNPPILKSKERDTWNADNLPVFIAVDILIRRRKDKNSMSQFLQFCFKGSNTGRNPRYLWKISICK